MYDHAKPAEEKYSLPAGLSHAALGRNMLQRHSLYNWLDPLRTGCPSPFKLSDVFVRPTLAELRLGLLNPGDVRMVDCIDANVTDFPRLTIEDLHEITTSPYLVSLAPSYVSSYRYKELEQTGHYLNLQQFHADRSQLSLSISGWMFDQLQMPNNWYGVWPGWSTPNTEPWEPVRILTIPLVPSRYTGNQSHTVVIAYVPTAWLLQSPAPAMCSPPNQRIQMYICGPRTLAKCKVGARLVGTCAHVATALYLCGLLAHNPAAFKSTWRELNYIDSGTGRSRPPAYSLDMLIGHIS